MAELSENNRLRIIEILQKGEDLPWEFRNILFPSEKKEYELMYSGKQQEKDILADMVAALLQPIKTFARNSSNGWTNKLIFGDNLQAMKSLLDDPAVKGRVKLIYIDPPFATKQEFRGRQHQKAYQDKVSGAIFLEFLRKRLIILKELLADDGSIYVHLDCKKAHYVKIIMDEIFKENNFKNEIIWHYRRWTKGSNAYQKMHDTLLFYSNSRLAKLNPVYIEATEGQKKKHHKGWDRNSVFINRRRQPQLLIYDQSKVDKAVKKGLINLKEFARIVVVEQDKTIASDVWDINYLNSQAKERFDYPTQKPEALLERIIKASANKGDIVLDAFAGSGTTLAVAEKSGCRWIGIDCGKLAIYTIQKRLFNMKSNIGNKGKELKPKPFTLYHTEEYKLSKLKKISWEEWRKFALLSFNCSDKKHTLENIKFDGNTNDLDVLVFNYQKEDRAILDYRFIDDLHSTINSSSLRKIVIIAPAARVTFLEDCIDKKTVYYYILRISGSIINELYHQMFALGKQSVSQNLINEIIESAGFDFIRAPKVECFYSIEKPAGKILECATIKIKTFESKAMLQGINQPIDRKSLSMVMVDFDYDEKIFKLDRVYDADEIKKNDWKIFLPIEEIKNKMMIIYFDIYGNEYREIKMPENFASL